MSQPPDDDFSISELRLVTWNLEPMVAWWSLALGRVPAVGSPRYALFAPRHDARVLLVRSTSSGPHDPETAGVDCVSLRCGDLAQLVRVYERMAAAGYEPELADNDGLTLALWYRDPDRNSVRVELGLPASIADWAASDPLEREPLGVEIDARALVAAFRAGAPAEALLRPGGVGSQFVRLED